MKIAIASDLHLDHRPRDWIPVVEAITATDAEVLVLAGDIAEIVNYPWFDAVAQLAKGFEHVLYVLGNHEHYNTSSAKCKAEIEELESLTPNLHVLEEKTLTVDGVTFAGTSLWFDVDDPSGILNSSRLNDFRIIPDSWERIRGYREKSMGFLAGLSNVDVMITHHAPSYRCVPPRFNGSALNVFFANRLDKEVKRIGPKYWIHGHMHDLVNVQVGDTKVIANPLGYPRENATWNPLVVEV